MKNNVGLIDRVVRIILGLGIGILGIVYDNWLGLIGLVLIVTALLKWCPLYWLTKLSTVKK